MQLKHNKARLSGFTLVETLVALVVMSVGMLGIAALYIEGLRSGQTSIARTTAVNLAADMADRIRSNPTVPNNVALPSSVPQSLTPAAPVYAAGASGRQQRLRERRRELQPGTAGGGRLVLVEPRRSRTCCPSAPTPPSR